MHARLPFCQAGYIYRPVPRTKERNPSWSSRGAIGCTGYDEVSLLSLEHGGLFRGLRHELVPQLIRQMEAGKSSPVALPSHAWTASWQTI